jgi:YidC/Oxa1 family membrane protein insertase
MKFKKIAMFIGLFVVMAATLSSCTKSFCTVNDKAQTLYALEEYAEGKTYAEGKKTQEINKDALSKGMLTPSNEFNAFIETKIDEYADQLVIYYSKTAPYKDETQFYTYEYARGIALFAGGENLEENTLWYNFDKWVKEAQNDPSVGLANCPDGNYITLYKQTFETIVANKTTCISPVTGEYDGIVIEGKTWKQAFSLGLFEGLLVYPISWLIYTLTMAFSALGGFGTVLSIFLVTLIVRGVLILATFKQTLSQQKMTLLQPELNKIQNKYPNAATNPYDKQRLGQEQMALYKKHNINPFGMFIVLIFQFPIFISVWGAMQGSSILMSGEFLGLSLATSTGTAMMDFKGPWVVAWVIFILMAIGQVLAMKIPQYIQKKKQEKQQKLVKNPTADQQMKTMNMVNNVMLIMIIVMGFSLPVSMCIYWFITSLISLGQSFLTNKIIAKANNKKVVRK